MHDPALGSKTVLGPLPFHMDESALSLAEQEVLQGRKRQQLVFGVYEPFLDLYARLIYHILTKFLL